MAIEIVDLPIENGDFPSIFNKPMVSMGCLNQPQLVPAEPLGFQTRAPCCSTSLGQQSPTSAPPPFQGVCPLGFDKNGLRTLVKLPFLLGKLMIYGYISNKTAVFSGENDDKHIKI